MKKILLLMVLLTSVITINAKSFVFSTSDYKWSLDNKNWTFNKTDNSVIVYNDDDINNVILAVNNPVRMNLVVDNIYSMKVHGIEALEFDCHNNYHEIYHVVVYEYEKRLFFVFYGKINVIFRIKVQ